MNNLTVAKFGGTSVADHAAMSRCADIICENQDIRVVAVSAQSGVTNILVRLTQSDVTADERQTLIDQIRDKEYAILNDLNQPESIKVALENLLAELTSLAENPELPTSLKLKDALLSFGEQMSSLMFAELLRQRGVHAVNFDIRQVMKTDDNFAQAEPQLALIKQQAETLLKPELSGSVVVTQGFIGSNAQGETTTLGRGGSDYSAALIAEALEASVLQIWTDVTGIFTTDPRLTKAARPIPEVTFDEAAEMATFGAKILHPATLIPAMRRDIRVFVGSSRAPKEGGTWVVNKAETKPPYRAIALRKDQILLTVKSPQMLHATGFLAKVFGILAEHKISVDLVTTSEISIALTLDNPTNTTTSVLSDTVLSALKSFCDVKVEENLSLVAVIGNHLESSHKYDKKPTENKLWKALDSVDVRMICQGASPHNLCFLTPTDSAPAVVESLHDVLFD
ncbi:lysine-sensitive aspartokinase 3 [Saccharobesus litoralis]|uniref:Aspartokinase n=1 Tax=Saccharobesus litoralis TaxID=2172099 RepID=A0A2S0VXA1_9ALTE|nr:lysine-sensitive aspartokinase 3 [Saccharobesus litoralis]AWB68857.1 lysine-sensitive aspartokinase 3 [Saccharobesus litoralis]